MVLLQLMEKFDVSEINLQNDDESWKIRRGPRVAYAQPAATPQFTMPMAAPTQVASATSASPVAAAATPSAPAGITINAPTVGTFYAAASPEDARTLIGDALAILGAEEADEEAEDMPAGSDYAG